ncbi:MAG: CPBP family intramembrane metalloprotease [Planctomycetes bacterium]|nr:CPBP family intramembrane metalloprotease [Planctomycetota bacterium]
MTSDEMNNQEPIAANVAPDSVSNANLSMPTDHLPSTLQTPPSTQDSKPRLWTVFLTTVSATLCYLGISLASLFIAVVVVAALSVKDSTKKSPDELMNAVFEHPASIFYLLIPGHIALLGIAIFAAILSPTPFAARLSLNRPTWPWWATAAAVLTAPFLSFLWSMVISNFVEPNAFLEKMESMFQSTTENFGFGVTLLCIAVVPAFSEEWLFRGYVQTRLAQRWSPWLAILVSSLLFAVFHLDPVHVLAVFPMGLWLGFISWRCGSIIPAMIAHTYNNSLSLVGVVYDQTDSLDATMSSFANQVTVYLGVPALLVIFSYLIVSRSRTQTPAIGLS